MTIEGLDTSKWQGTITAAMVEKMVAQGIRFVYVKFSQGLSHKDPQAENSTQLLQAGGIKVGPYHFTENVDPAVQHDNFVAAMKEFQFDLPPDLDCEAYVALAGRALDLPPVGDLLNYTPRSLKQAHLDHLRANDPNPYKLAFFRLVPSILYKYSYPSAAVVWSIADKLSKVYMLAQTKLVGKFPDPAIYTNASSGNKIFGTNTGFARFPLHIANWTTNPVPYLPAAWNGKAHFIWQNGVVNAAPYGLDSLKVDHNLWGDLLPFPGSEPPPPPPPSGEKAIYIKIGEDEYEGTVSEVEDA